MKLICPFCNTTVQMLLKRFSSLLNFFLKIAYHFWLHFADLLVQTNFARELLEDRTKSESRKHNSV